MTSKLISPLACGLAMAIGLSGSLAQASSTAAFSISDSIAASVGSISNSVRRSSDSSSKATGVAEGNYRIIEVALAGDEHIQLQLEYQAQVPNAVAPEETRLLLRMPLVVWQQHGLDAGQQLSIRHRPYGLEIAAGQPLQAIYLLLDDVWQQGLQSQLVTL